MEQYLVFAQGQAMRRIPMYMKDWSKKLNGFLTLNDRDILNHAGKMSHPLALEHTESGYEKFHVLQIGNFESDFDNAVNKISKNERHH